MITKKNSAPAISVIIPTYNRGWCIKEAVGSVLEQDCDDYELLVVDDGSTDNTLDILQSYGHAITLIRQPNQGVSAARNKGIEASSGQLIAFLDSDDIWLPQKLSRQLEFFNAHPQALVNQTQEVWIRNGRRVNPKKHHQKVSGMIFQRSLALCLVSPSAVMVRKNLFDIVGNFDESLPACEDYDLWLRVSCRYPVYLIETPLTIKRGGHDDQLSKAAGLDKFRVKALLKILESNLLSGSQYRAAAKALQDKCTIFANGCRKRGRHSEARLYEQLAAKYSL
jgi:glycosyltransferase involved in cell wall biosynthesis